MATDQSNIPPDRREAIAEARDAAEDEDRDTLQSGSGPSGGAGQREAENRDLNVDDSGEVQNQGEFPQHGDSDTETVDPQEGPLAPGPTGGGDAGGGSTTGGSGASGGGSTTSGGSTDSDGGGSQADESTPTPRGASDLTDRTDRGPRAEDDRPTPRGEEARPPGNEVTPRDGPRGQGPIQTGGGSAPEAGARDVPTTIATRLEADLESEVGGDLQRGEDFVITVSGGGYTADLTDQFKREQALGKLKSSLPDDASLDAGDVTFTMTEEGAISARLTPEFVAEEIEGQYSDTDLVPGLHYQVFRTDEGRLTGDLTRAGRRAVTRTEALEQAEEALEPMGIDVERGDVWIADPGRPGGEYVPRFSNDFAQELREEFGRNPPELSVGDQNWTKQFLEGQAEQLERIDKQFDEQAGEDLQPGVDYAVEMTDRGVGFGYQADVTNRFRDEQRREALAQLDTRVDNQAGVDLQRGEDYTVETVTEDGTTQFQTALTPAGQEAVRKAKRRELAQARDALTADVPAGAGSLQTNEFQSAVADLFGDAENVANDVAQAAPWAAAAVDYADEVVDPGPREQIDRQLDDRAGTDLIRGRDYTIKTVEKDGETRYKAELTAQGATKLRTDEGQTWLDRQIETVEDVTGFDVIPGEGDVVQGVESFLVEQSERHRRGQGWLPSPKEARNLASSPRQAGFFGRVSQQANVAEAVLGAGTVVETAGEIGFNTVLASTLTPSQDAVIEESPLPALRSDAVERLSDTAATAESTYQNIGTATAASFRDRPGQTAGSLTAETQLIFGSAVAPSAATTVARAARSAKAASGARKVFRSADVMSPESRLRTSTVTNEYLPQFSSDVLGDAAGSTRKTTQKAAEEFRGRMRDYTPDPIIEELGGPAAKHGTRAKLPSSFRAAPGTSEIEGLFLSAEASPLRLARGTKQALKDYLPSRPQPGPRLIMTDASVEAMPESVRTAQEATEFLREEADRGTAYIRSGATRTAEQEAIVAPGSGFAKTPDRYLRRLEGQNTGFAYKFQDQTIPIELYESVDEATARRLADGNPAEADEFMTPSQFAKYSRERAPRPSRGPSTPLPPAELPSEASPRGTSASTADAFRLEEAYTPTRTRSLLSGRSRRFTDGDNTRTTRTRSTFDADDVSVRTQFRSRADTESESFVSESAVSSVSPSVSLTRSSTAETGRDRGGDSEERPPTSPREPTERTIVSTTSSFSDPSDVAERLKTSTSPSAFTQRGISVGSRSFGSENSYPGFDTPGYGAPAGSGRSPPLELTIGPPTGRDDDDEKDTTDRERTRRQRDRSGEEEDPELEVGFLNEYIADLALGAAPPGTPSQSTLKKEGDVPAVLGTLPTERQIEEGEAFDETVDFLSFGDGGGDGDEFF